VSGVANRRQRRQALSDGNRLQKELDDAIAVELLLELGIGPDGRHDGLDDATRAAALKRTRALIKDKAAEMVRLYRIGLPPLRPARAVDDQPPPAPETTDDQARWRVVAGLSSAGPPRQKIERRPRGWNLGAAFEFAVSEERISTDSRKFSRPRQAPVAEAVSFCREPAAWRPIGDVADTVLATLRRQRLVARVHPLGDRVFFELLDELDRHGIAPWALIEPRLERFAALDPELLAALGGDRMPSAPLHLVRDISDDQEGEN
jgi:hypothetical protein